tara:strand:+ start:8127 stop:8918 length:792 start_codon:yes stop_codon:yes gene_type:complete
MSLNKEKTLNEYKEMYFNIEEKEEEIGKVSRVLNKKLNSEFLMLSGIAILPIFLSLTMAYFIFNKLSSSFGFILCILFCLINILLVPLYFYKRKNSFENIQELIRKEAVLENNYFSLILSSSFILTPLFVLIVLIFENIEILKTLFNLKRQEKLKFRLKVLENKKNREENKILRSFHELEGDQDFLNKLIEENNKYRDLSIFEMKKEELHLINLEKDLCFDKEELNRKILKSKLKIINNPDHVIGVRKSNTKLKLIINEKVKS